jgi:hypothetical protein
MDHIGITDIFNNKVSPSKAHILPFILIHTNKPHLILTKVSDILNTDGVWKPIQPVISKILHANNINPDRFGTLGDIWFPYTTLPQQLVIPLVNSNISSHPLDYVKIDNYANLNIWKPVAPNHYHEIGLVVSLGKPKLNEVRVLDRKYITPYAGQSDIVLRNTNMNEYHLLANIESIKHTIYKDLLKEKINIDPINTIQQSLDPLPSIAKNNGKWDTCEGKKFVLIEPDTPWYKSKNNSTPSESIKNEPTQTEPISKQIDLNVIICSLSLFMLLLFVIRYYFN